jgi:hypothetical protein
MPESIYIELGYPDRLVASVDEKNRAMKLETSEWGYRVSKVTSATKYKSGSVNVYQGFKPGRQSATRRKLIFKSLPYGRYKPIGGGVFEFVKDSHPARLADRVAQAKQI